MTASNPCCECKEPLTIESPSKEVSNCGYCGLPVKETPAAIEKNCHCAVPLIATKDTPLLVGGKECLRCGLAINWDARIADSKQQPAKEWWEASTRKFMSQFILHCDQQGDCQGCAADMDGIIEHISCIAAQSEKKGRELAVDYIEAECEFVRQDVPDGNDGYYAVRANELEAARSSEEGKNLS